MFIMLTCAISMASRALHSLSLSHTRVRARTHTYTTIYMHKGVQSMTMGQSASLEIVPKYAFGADGDAALGVAANATVTATVAIVSFENEKAERTVDGTALSHYPTGNYCPMIPRQLVNTRDDSAGVCRGPPVTHGGFALLPCQRPPRVGCKLPPQGYVRHVC